MKNKDKQIGARVDQETYECLDKANKISGVPLSEIIRRGALYEALQIIQLFDKRIDKNKQKSEAA